MQPSLYLVAYIDLLGQSAELNAINALPNTPTEWQVSYDAIMPLGALVRELRNAAAQVDRFRPSSRDALLGFSEDQAEVRQMVGACPLALARQVRERRRQQPR